MPAGKRNKRTYLLYTLFFIYGVIGRDYIGFIEIVHEKQMLLCENYKRAS